MRKIPRLAALVPALLLCLCGRAAGAEELRTELFNGLLWSGVSVRAGISREELCGSFEGELSYSVYRGDEMIAFDYRVPVTWQGIPLTASVAGDYPILCTPHPPADAPAEFPPFTITLHIVPPHTPHIASVMEGGGVIILYFMDEIWDAESIQVMYSADDGRTWASVLNFNDQSYIDEFGAGLAGVPLGDGYRFRMEVEGGSFAGVSQIFDYPPNDGRASEGAGEDKDHGDRDDQGETPPAGELIPPPKRSVPRPEGSEAPNPTEPTQTPNAESTPRAGSTPEPAAASKSVPAPSAAPVPSRQNQAVTPVFTVAPHVHAENGAAYVPPAGAAPDAASDSASVTASDPTPTPETVIPGSAAPKAADTPENTPAPDRTAGIDAVPVQASDAPPASAPEPDPAPRPGKWVLAGAGGLVLAVGAAALVMVRKRKR